MSNSLTVVPGMQQSDFQKALEDRLVELLKSEKGDSRELVEGVRNSALYLANLLFDSRATLKVELRPETNAAFAPIKKAKDAAATAAANSEAAVKGAAEAAVRQVAEAVARQAAETVARQVAEAVARQVAETTATQRGRLSNRPRA